MPSTNRRSTNRRSTNRQYPIAARVIRWAGAAAMAIAMLVALPSPADAQDSCEGLTYNEALTRDCSDIAHRDNSGTSDPTTATTTTTASSSLRAGAVDSPGALSLDAQSTSGSAGSVFAAPATPGSGTASTQAQESAAASTGSGLASGPTQVAFTGSSSAVVSAFGSAILLGGGALVVAARHRAEHEDQTS